jgi:hypothetical protein
MVEAPIHCGVEFLKDAFGVSTKANVYVCSLPNEDARDREAGEKHVMSREGEVITRFTERYDRKDRALYFCVSTVAIGATRRAKETVVEIIGLFCDIDLKNVTASAEDVLARLKEAPHRPSKVVASGNGFHAYWIFKEALEASEENRERIERALGLLCDHFGGDPAVCHIAALMRLPGTHNTKNGDWKEVQVIVDLPIRYAWLDELEEWLETSRPVILRKPKANGHDAQPLNPFEAVAAQFATRPPVDVEKTLNEMALGNIHSSQLSVSAALLNRGENIEDVTQIVIDATRAAAGDYATRWNWRREEKTVRKMCADWVKKHPETVRTAAEVAKAEVETVRKNERIEWVDFDKAKRPAKTCANASMAIEALGIDCRKDAFHEQMLVGGHRIAKWAGQLSDDAVLMLRRLIKEEYGFDPGTNNMRDAAIQLCLQNQFNPVTEYLAALRWDGTERLDRWLIAYLGAQDTPLNREFGRLTLLAAVRRARQPGCKFDQILVLEGPQGRGKSTAIRILAGEENYSDQNILAASDREQQEAFTGIWIHEIAELSGMTRAEVERVKQFASRTEDRARPAYGRIRVDMKRRGIFTATTNRETYLKDDTGNRRFWPVRVEAIDLDAIARDRDQIWAEAAHLEASGASMKLGEEFWERAAEEQEARTEEDVWLEKIAAHTKLLPSTSVHDVLVTAIGMEVSRIGQVEQNRASRCLRKLGFVRKRDSTADRDWKYVKKTGTDPEGQIRPSVPVRPSKIKF